jgi:NADH-quinone oxidoreductase subunit A
MKPIDDLAMASPWESGLLSLALYAFMVSLVVAAILFFAARLGERKPDPEKLKPWECGITPTGTARARFPIPFYLVAAFFLIFDVEAVYIFSWAIAARLLGWEGWLQITFFILILLISLFYLWGKGGLDWGPIPPPSSDNPKT